MFANKGDKINKKPIITLLYHKVDRLTKYNNSVDFSSLLKEFQTLTGSLSPKRKVRLLKAALDFALTAEKTLLIFEDIQDPFNVAACFRTMANLGIYRADLFYHRLDKPTINSRIIAATSSGVGKWISHRVITDVPLNEYIFQIKKKGYKVVATALDSKAKPLTTFDFSRFEKLALVFGNETNGVSEDLISMADETLYIPMATFETSFNISVSVGMVLWEYVNSLGLQEYWYKHKELAEKIITSPYLEPVDIGKQFKIIFARAVYILQSWLQDE